MNFLAINTAGKSTQIALVVNGKQILSELEFSKHSENLFPLLSKTLEENNLSLDDFDTFACVVGPGSFTGIRIGLSVVKGFAFAKSKPCIGVTSLELLAYNEINADTSKPICAVINAGADLVYHQIFEIIDKNGKKQLKAVTQPRLDKIKHFTGFLHSNYKDDVTLIYNHNNEKNTGFADLLGESKDFGVESLVLAVNAKIENNDFSNAVTLSPLYLRVSQAEQNFKSLNFRKATIDDLQKILKLENQDDDYDLPWSEISVRQSFDNPNFECYLLESDGECLGMISIMRLIDEAEIMRVIVLRKVRLQGIAQKMFTKLIDTLRAGNVKSIFLEVNNFNYPAISLYQKIGFMQVGIRPDYYEPNQDAILMRLDI